jgi:hypothetical protein
MIKVINEQIAMLAAFQKDGKIEPLMFSWQGQKYQDLKIESTWTVQEGQFVKVYFSLMKEAITYEVYFYTKHLHWILSKIHS